MWNCLGGIFCKNSSKKGLKNNLQKRNFGQNVIGSQSDTIYKDLDEYFTRKVDVSNHSSVMSFNASEIGEYNHIGIQAGSPLRNMQYKGILTDGSASFLTNSDMSFKSSFDILSSQSLNSLPRVMDIKYPLGPIANTLVKDNTGGLAPLKKVPIREKNEKVLKPIVVQPENKLPPVNKDFLLRLEREHDVDGTLRETKITTNLLKESSFNKISKNNDEDNISLSSKKSDFDEMSLEENKTVTKNQITEADVKRTKAKPHIPEEGSIIIVETKSNLSRLLSELYDEEELDLIASIEAEFNTQLDY